MRYEDDRIEKLERQLEELAERVERLEGPKEAAPRRPAPTTWPAPEREREERPRAPELRAPEIDLEELLGGRVLAWVGGIAIVLGIVFFLGMAISRGWIDEPTRTVLAALGSTALLGMGVWLYERRGRTQAALAAVAAGLAGLYATLTVATQVYELVSPLFGLVCAAIVGATGTGIAVRWQSRIVGGIGLVGAVLAPVLVDAGTSNASLAFMAVALTASVAVLVWQRWNWFAGAIFLVSAPQLLDWVDDSYRTELGFVLAVLLAYWGLFVLAAIGYELRTGSTRVLPVASWLLLLSNVLLVAGTGWFVLDDTGHGDAATGWVLALAAGHVALGAWSLRQRISPEIGLLLVAVGLGLSAIGFALALSGPALVAGWAVHAVFLTYVGRRAASVRALVGAAAFLTLALLHVLVFEAPLDSLRNGVDELGTAVVAIACVAAAALLAARFVPSELADGARVLEAVGAALLIYLGSVAIVDTLGVGDGGETLQTGQVLLSAFWTLTGLGAIVYGLVRDERRLRFGGLSLLGLAVAKVYVYDLAELEEIYRVLSFIALGLLLLAGAFAYQRIRHTVAEDER